MVKCKIWLRRFYWQQARFDWCLVLKFRTSVSQLLGCDPKFGRRAVFIGSQQCIYFAGHIIQLGNFNVVFSRHNIKIECCGINLGGDFIIG